MQPNQGTGVPMLEVLQEMGFTLEFLYYVGDDTEPDPALPGACQGFQDAAELEELLRASEAAAFYSEYYFDRRLTRCGKAQFSVSNFRLGFEGAIDTLRQLLHVCELPFYRRYAAYLGKPFDLPPESHGAPGRQPSEQEQR